MNKKETAEIKKNFSDKSGFFIMERVLTGFVDAEKNVRFVKTFSCLTMSVEEHGVYDETLKKELESAGLMLIERSMTTIEEYAMPGFLPQMTAVVVRRKTGGGEDGNMGSV